MKNQEADQNSKDVLLLEMDVRMRKPLCYIQLKIVRRAGDVAPLVECLPSKLKALSSILVQPKREKYWGEAQEWGGS
jgi:hypothetical protein